MKSFIAIVLVGVFGSSALAQSEGFAWGENVGYLNWSAANGEDQGPVLGDESLSGFVWGENISWVNLGDGGVVPDRELQTGADFGVGVDSDGYCFGYGWGENVGWITFGPFVDGMGNPIELCRCGAGVTDCADGSCVDARPRIRRGRLRGYAWAENIGWINLDDEDVFVQLRCPADLTGDGTADFFDISAYLALYSAGSLRADWNDDGQLDFFDISGLLVDLGEGCP